LVASTLGVGMLLTIAPARHVLEIRDPDHGHALLQSLPTDASGSFVLSFTHSMYGGRVTEQYYMLNGALERTTVETETGGAAEYYAPLGNFHRAGSHWVVDVEPMVLPNLYVSVTPIGHQAIEAGGVRVDLGAIVPSGHTAELVAES
ncbi:MAG TPA: hypothetical protein VF157_15560, partial [Chloroflexota bacterium]